MTLDFQNLLLSFDGRIRRRDFWLGVIALIVVSIVLIIVLGLILGPTAATIVGNLIMLYPSAALVVKRLHDRDKAANPWAFVFIGVPTLSNLAQTFGVGFDAMRVPVGDLGEVAMPGLTPDADGMLTIMTPTPLGMVIMLVGAAVAIWGLVELGFLSGTKGPNRFGPDPKGDVLPA